MSHGDFVAGIFENAVEELAGEEGGEEVVVVRPVQHLAQHGFRENGHEAAGGLDGGEFHLS